MKIETNKKEQKKLTSNHNLQETNNEKEKEGIARCQVRLQPIFWVVPKNCRVRKGGFLFVGKCVVVEEAFSSQEEVFEDQDFEDEVLEVFAVEEEDKEKAEVIMKVCWSSFSCFFSPSHFASLHQGPPAEVVEMGEMWHPCEEELVCKSTNEKIPYFNAPHLFAK